MKYLIAFEIETSLNSYQEIDSFKYKSIELKLSFKGPKKLLFIESEGQTSQEAVAKIAPVVAEALGPISYFMQTATFLMDPVLMLRGEKGKKERTVYIVSKESKTRGPYLTDRNTAAIQKLLSSSDENTEIILRWYRWAIRATTLLEKYVYLWLALERAVGESMQYARCKHDHEVKVCPLCTSRLNKYTTINKNGLEKILESIPEGAQIDIKDLRKTRNEVFHGKSKIDMSKISQIIPILEKAVQKFLDDKMSPDDRLTIAPVQKTFQINRHAIFKFETSDPQKEYAEDYPSVNEAADYLEDPNKTYGFELVDNGFDYSKW